MPRFVLAVAVTVSVAAAQPNIFEIYPDGTNTATNVYWRGNVVGFAPGELLQQYPERHLRGIGDAGTVWLGPPSCSIRGVTYEIADSNAATPSTYRIVLRSGPGAPICGVPGEIFVSPSLTTPPGVGFVAWNLTTTFAPVTVPCAQDWYVGLRIPQGSAADALLVAASRWTVGAGDNPQPNAPTHAWEIPTPCAPMQLFRHTWHYGVLIDCPAFNIGADHPGGLPPDPGFGMAGMYPVLPRPDGLCFRVRDLANAGGTMQLFVSFPPVGAGFVPGISLQPLLKGSLHMAGFTSLGTAPIPATGEAIKHHPCFAPSALCMVSGISWEFQAIAFGVTPQPRLSNAQRTTFF